MLDLVDGITHAVNVTLTRQFEREAGERGARLDLEEPLRPAAQPHPANHRAYSVSVEDLLRSTGDLMVRLLLPVPTQGHLQRIDGSISITTNDVELPWELLYDRGQVLALKNPVARMPMGRAFPRAGRTPVRVDGRSRMLLIYADPEANLPTAEAEVDLIREALVSGFGDKVLIDVWKGQDAEGRALTDALRFGSYDVIHYAGHADFDVEDPVLSGLLLHDGERFAAQKIGRLLEGRPLFYLNACETGRVASEERPQGVFRYAARLVEGLASALIPRGALGCIGALWTIYDRPAAEFAVDFYRRLLEGQTTGEAIRQARLESKSRYPEQITWASPVLYGDPTHRLVV
jgi:CHAT domain-containing protein